MVSFISLTMKHASLKPNIFWTANPIRIIIQPPVLKFVNYFQNSQNLTRNGWDMIFQISLLNWLLPLLPRLRNWVLPSLSSHVIILLLMLIFVFPVLFLYILSCSILFFFVLPWIPDLRWVSLVLFFLSLLLLALGSKKATRTSFRLNCWRHLIIFFLLILT